MTVKSIDFVAKPSKMGNRIAILIPVQFHKEFMEKKLLNKFMKFHGEEILDQQTKKWMKNFNFGEEWCKSITALIQDLNHLVCLENHFYQLLVKSGYVGRYDYNKKLIQATCVFFLKKKNINGSEMHQAALYDLKHPSISQSFLVVTWPLCLLYKRHLKSSAIGNACRNICDRRYEKRC